MATAEQLISVKGDTVASLSPKATVLEAAQLMNERHIGSVLVIGNKRMAGIFTERDVLRRVVAEQRDPAMTRLADVMTRQVACAAPRTTLDEIRAVMREKRIRHIPVLDGERVAGMISIGDLNKAEHEREEQTIRYLERYISVA
ncbi:MAG: CBS domain-containing protein [Planctomycetota bacterium]|jgi:CBS domain-containing protein